MIGVNELVLLVAALLDGVNAAAIGLMAAVSVQLGASAIRDPLTVTLDWAAWRSWPGGAFHQSCWSRSAGWPDLEPRRSASALNAPLMLR